MFSSPRKNEPTILTTKTFIIQLPGMQRGDTSPKSYHLITLNCSATTEEMCKIWGSVWGVLNWSNDWLWTKRYNKTHACIVVHTMAFHNHLIDWYYILSSFAKLMVIDVLRVLLKYFHSIAYDKTSLMNFIHLLGCDTIVIVILFKMVWKAGKVKGLQYCRR